MAEYIKKESAIHSVTVTEFEEGNFCDAKIRIAGLPPAEVVRKELYNQIMWERDTAIEQLSKLGYGFGEKVEPIVKKSKIDKAIEEIEDLDPITERVGQQVKQEILNILKRNIGE